MKVKLALLRAENRYARLSVSVKNFKCPGVLRKLRRQLRNLKAQTEQF